ncbi:UBIQUITIN CONJUGATING ENZYME E2-17kDa [Encephalitozoon cuniculi GB-M1]|uniref:UBIQUITIN CONJUGATING ENZYME E2-17kDa n=2 Tax=Encephalitozoon cuniculi TaxID=6035 RepID=Q8SR17_ENCCU|nr:ubiquitin-conjugating enzyme E2 [Encephalitozoon cuniculi GB-M1]AGE96184.1 ubiquitin conjugating enzyme e2-17kDa [Encephalitozoon cuniculi]KMV65283.1 ubiquitin-conjugating enzyme E2 [Encephalitozoon cuniculi EcunIII-L]UYI26593.1 ubiquitin conjugating enzyme E2 [Encephalitozoon cuniculi]CAD25850.1 UBIQUITIN CONJUGATING ENZYME E2-17kDa [Encephalitozoon cuniculi GB-M1]
MSTPAKRRLMKDLKRVRKSPCRTIFAEPLEDDLMTWAAVIFGPDSTPFEGGTFSLVLTFPETYPQDPPAVRFVSEMFHPNIYPNGELCLDILSNRWNPSYDVIGVLISIQSLLNDPNTTSPANTDAASLFSTDPRSYARKVKDSVIKSWVDVENLRDKYTDN